MSKLADRIEELIQKNFPLHKYKREEYVSYQNTKLFFDFILPQVKVLIEVQGQQHYAYSKFFHKDKLDFQKQKYRDSLKRQWVDQSPYNLVTFKYNEIPKLSDDDFKKRIISSIG